MVFLGITTWRSPGARSGRGCVAEQPSQADGGQRNQRHEGRPQRRAQLQRSGRMVAEAYKPGVGLAIGNGHTSPDDVYQAWLDSRSLYHLLEHEIAPKSTIVATTSSASWLEMMRRSMSELAPKFSTARMVREYASRFYMPASQAFTRLRSDGLGRAKDALAWRQKVRSARPQVSVAKVTHSAETLNAVGDRYQIESWSSSARSHPRTSAFK